MGMYTDYQLDAPPEAIAWLRAHCEEAFSGLDENGETDEPQQWYRHEEDVAKLSRGFPDQLIVLHGVGEEPGDLWRKYFRAGHVQVARAVITYPECELGDCSAGADPEPLAEIVEWVERRREEQRLRERLEELEMDHWPDRPKKS